jgi:Fe-S cluster assembly ATP-binding protein
MPANEMLKVIREKSELLEIDRKFFSFIKRRIFVERKRNEIFQMADVRTKISYLMKQILV